MNRLLRSLLAVAAATLVAGSPAAAASCNGNGHNITLSNGTASPGSGTPSTAVTFSVRYADSGGCAADSVAVTISGAGTFGGFSRSGSDYQAGVTFSRTISLPAGTHQYSFSATSGRKSGTLSAVSPGSVVISAPPPPPTPRPSAQPAPQPTPPPSPPATTQPAQQPPPPPQATVPPTSAPTRTPNATSTPTASPTQSAAPAATASAGALVDGWWLSLQARPDLQRRPGAPQEAEAPLVPAWWSLDFGDLDGVEILGPLLAYGTTTAGGLAMFFILLRRRGANESARPPLIAATVPQAATGAAAGSAPPTSPPAPSADAPDADGVRLNLGSMRDLVPPLDPDLLRDPDGPAGPSPNEAGIPRWLRPSVRKGRFGEERRRRDWGD